MSKIYFSVLLGLALAILSCNSQNSEECIDSSEGEIRDGRFYHKGYLYTGCVERNDSIEPRAIFPLVDGVLEGEYKEFYENGQTLLTQEYSNGKKHGLYVIYWENNTVSDSFSYVNDSPDGEILGYHKDGSERSWDFYSKGNSEKYSICFFDSTKRTYFWGPRKSHMNVGDWFYKLEEDSCLIRTFLENNESFDTPCDCNEIIYPPLDDW